MNGLFDLKSNYFNINYFIEQIDILFIYYITNILGDTTDIFMIISNEHLFIKSILIIRFI